MYLWSGLYGVGLVSRAAPRRGPFIPGKREKRQERTERPEDWRRRGGGLERAPSGLFTLVPGLFTLVPGLFTLVPRSAPFTAQTVQRFKTATIQRDAHVKAFYEAQV